MGRLLSWAPAGRAKREFAPPGNWTKKQMFLENLKSTSWFRLIDLILAITFYLLVWHSHCARVRFTVLVSCSDELAVHSGPHLRLQTQILRNLPAHCSTVALCWVTITWGRIFKGSLEVTIVNVFSVFDWWPQTSLTGDEFLAGQKIWQSKIFDVRRATAFSSEYHLSKRKMTTYSKNLGGMAL